MRTTQLPSIPEREGTKEVVVSCSTTGQPRPTIDWAFSDDHFSVSQGEATTTANDDGTFTSSRNVSVRALPGESGYVDCLVNTGRAGERRERVLFSISPEDKASEEGMCEPAVTRVVCPLIPPHSVCKRTKRTGQVEAFIYCKDWTLQCQCGGETARGTAAKVTFVQKSFFGTKTRPLEGQFSKYFILFWIF